MGQEPSFGGMVGLAARAMEAGADRRSLSHFEWDVAGNCTAPLTREIAVRPDTRPDSRLIGVEPGFAKALRELGLVPNVPCQGGYYWEAGLNHMLWASITVRCRKCDNCLRERARRWARKAMLEIQQSPRTWFATYTATPDQQFRWLLQARMLCGEDHPLEAHTADEQFKLRCRAAGPDITRYIKRIRKQSKARIRYLWVAERHSSGLPHFHALIHEVRADMPIRKTVLREQWPHGFSKFKLTENTGTAWYLCKYLSKDLASRVRGSLQYGHAVPFHLSGSDEGA